MISRRQLLYFSALFSFFYPIVKFKHFLMADERNDNYYSLTIEILKEAYRAEVTASMHYDEYCQKALSENYPNIAYLFFALSNSEKIHAINYKNLMVSLDVTFESMEIPVFSADTKKNLNHAAKKEPMVIHTDMDPEERRTRVMALLEMVGLNPNHYQRFSHEFFGGQRQLD